MEQIEVIKTCEVCGTEDLSSHVYCEQHMPKVVEPEQSTIDKLNDIQAYIESKGIHVINLDMVLGLSLNDSDSDCKITVIAKMKNDTKE